MTFPRKRLRPPAAPGVRAGKRCAYVLSGGGVYGAVQVGMIRALVEAGHVPDFISAVSVGALNGVVMAQKPSLEGVEQLEAVWRDVRSRVLFPGTAVHKAMAMFRHGHLCDNSGVKQLIERNARVEVFEDLKVPLVVTAVDLTTGKPRVFSSGPLRSALLATTALPGVFPPIEIGGTPYIDGGVVTNIPTAPALAAGPDRLFVLDVTRPVANRLPSTAVGMLVQAINITRNVCAERDLEAARLVPGAVVLPRAEDEPVLAYDDTSRTCDLMEAGYERTKRFLANELSDVA